ncbi:GIY-YIG nuclease family protein [Patescibacteria group bacterium]|nr:GIY-YIG nuclease family protein [Patescibacteria group bacterium]
MSDPFTIRIFIPEGDPEGIRIIDRLHSTGVFIVFPRSKWGDIRSRSELNSAGVYILSGYTENSDDLPTLYIGQADNVRSRIEQHVKEKDFWDRAVVFVSKINSAHAKWLEYSLISQALKAKRSNLENGNSPQEPAISEAEKADMKVFLREIYQTLPLIGLRAFEMPKAVADHETQLPTATNDKDTIVVPAQKEGFEEVFLGKSCWYAVRISGGMLNKIKYIAGYQTWPISAITHYAPVERIEPYGEEGKYKIIFSRSAIELKPPIVFGDAIRGSMQNAKYTSFEKLKKAKKLVDLFR